MFLEGEIRSLHGIERFQQLDTVFMERVPSPELSLLAELPNLQWLTILEPVGQVDYSQLLSLSHLERLEVSVERRADAEQIASLDYSRLQNLTDLTLRFLSTERPVQIQLPWLGRLPRLEALALEQLAFTAEEEARVCIHAGQLTRLLFTPVSDQQIDRMRECLPRTVRLIPMEEPDREEDTVVPTTDSSGGMRYELRIDLANHWGLETNVEAFLILEDELQLRAPELAARITLDPESTWLFAYAESQEDLEALRVLISERAAKTERRAPD